MKYPEIFDPTSTPHRDKIFLSMQKNDPIYYSPGEFTGWFFTRYDDIHSIFLDTRFKPGSTQSVIEEQAEEIRHKLAPLSSMLSMSLPELPKDRHASIHSLLQGYFSPRVISTLRQKIIKRAHELLLSIEKKGTFDLCKDFSNPLPASIIAELMGAPIKGLPLFIDWSESLMAIYKPFDLKKYCHAQDSLLALIAYCKSLLLKCREEQQDNILSTLNIAIEDKKISMDEALMNCAMLLFAGHETTATIIPIAIKTLIENPDQLVQLRNNPLLMPQVIDELIRYCNVGIFLRRTARENINYKGRKIKKGDLVFLGTYAANRDPLYFVEPNKFDIHRKNKKKPLTFGIGKHYCLGAALAKLELEVAIQLLLIDTDKYLPQIDHLEIQYHSMLARSIHKFPIVVNSSEYPSHL